MSIPSFDLAAYRARVAALAERGIYVGTSSWKYPGWLGQVYTAARYEYRGKFANTRFERDCLREYAETFKTVCVDAAYYTWPSEKGLRELADLVPEDFRFAFKVTDEVTLRHYPKLPRFGEQGGKLNENFLNAELFHARFLRPLEVIGPRAGPIIFEFSKFYPADYARGADFVADLDKFFAALPKGLRYGVELRNRNWLGGDYLACLQRHGVAHVLNNWTHMPPVSEQLGLVGDRCTEEQTVARFLLKPGRDYEDAVGRFQPYATTQEINEDARGAGVALINGAILKPTRNGTFIYVNNRLEGNAIMTILALLDGMTALPARAAPPLVPPAAMPAPSPTARPATPQLDLGL